MVLVEGSGESVSPVRQSSKASHSLLPKPSNVGSLSSLKILVSSHSKQTGSSLPNLNRWCGVPCAIGIMRPLDLFKCSQKKKRKERKKKKRNTLWGHKVPNLAISCCITAKYLPPSPAPLAVVEMVNQ